MGVSDGVTTKGKAGGFEGALGPLLEPALAATADRVATIAGLAASERQAVLDGLARALTSTVAQLVNRLLVLELNAARVTGQLRAADSTARWAEFLDLAGHERYWRSYLPEHYPTLLPRLDQLVRARCAAAATLAQRFAGDRDDLTALLGTAPGVLTAVAMGAGDSHGGHTVSIVRCTGGAVVYKPRPLGTDRALSALLARVRKGAPQIRIDVPAVLDRDSYGWARPVKHRYCVDDGELRLFYRAIGHWLGVLRLLGGTDMHAENLVACGPAPVVVDCETIFTPHPPDIPSGLGAATDRAVELVRAVLRTGLLPTRRAGRREDASAAGNLPDHQPVGAAPAIIDRGTDLARLGARPTEPRRALNHPSQAPQPRRYWPELLAGLDEVTERLETLDRAGELDGLMDAFRQCRIRVVARSTSTYNELAWMLWHPVSLHDEPAAVRHATELMAAAPGSPHDPTVIAAEIADLLAGEVPVFVTTAGGGRIEGPGGTSWGSAPDLVADALHRWRGADRRRDRQVAQATLASAHLETRWRPEAPMGPVAVRHNGLDRRRRTLAATLMHELRDSAVRGADGTATWIAPVLDPAGWYVHASGLDLYGGAPGIAVLLAGYLHEFRHGRADPVDGLPELLEGSLRTVRLREDGRPGELRSPGAYLGLAGRIWCWLTLAGLGHPPDDGVARAVALAELLAEPARSPSDVFAGSAGAVVVLLRLAEITGEQRWTELAAKLGDGLTTPAEPAPSFPHGITGVGWALARLATVTGNPRTAARAAAAFDRQDRNYDATAQGWRDDDAAADDRRGNAAAPVAAWCHGAVGIGVAAADLLADADGTDPAQRSRHRETLRRAAVAGWAAGLGWNHTLCHGDLGTWELLSAALHHGVPPCGLDQRELDARVVAGLERHGPVLPYGITAPGLFTGIGGIAYQLLRMHPECELPSVLVLGQRRGSGS